MQNGAQGFTLRAADSATVQTLLRQTATAQTG
jgi:hypothetical protein